MISAFVMSSDSSEEEIAANIEQGGRQNQRHLDEFIRSIKIESHAARDGLDYLKHLTHLLKGSACQEVPALAKRLQVDCIVMGTVARAGIRGFFLGKYGVDHSRADLSLGAGDQTARICNAGYVE